MRMYAYIGIKPCGCVTCASTDREEDTEHTAEIISDWLRRGLKIKRVDVEEARRRLKRCKHKTNGVKEGDSLLYRKVY